MSKVTARKHRIVHIAKELNVSHRDIMDLLEKNGIEVHSHMSPVDEHTYQLIVDEFDKDRQTVERYRKEQIGKEIRSRKLEKYDLHEIFTLHLDEIISGPDIELEATLGECLREPSSNWSDPDLVQSILSLVRDLRAMRPKGMSKRQSKRKYVVDTLVEEVERIKEQQVRRWWERIEHHSIDAIIEVLPTVPEDSTEAVLHRFLRLSSSDSHIHNKQIHSFLQHAHSHLTHADRVMRPLVVTHIENLIVNGENSLADELLKLFPEHDESALGSVAAYMRFAISSSNVFGGITYDLGGMTEYSQLSEEDLFLGSCYYEGKASTILAKQTKWDYPFVRSSLLKQGGQDYLNHFKVRGLQPRIAELAFREIYGRLHGANAQKKLRDLNLEYVKRLETPWKLESMLRLPSSDWEDADGKKFDVKSNLFYRSVTGKIGLRGFLISRPESKNQAFQGIVFTGSNPDSCEWVYVGEFHPKEWPKTNQDRLLPFYFRLPDSHRHVRMIRNSDPQVGLELLQDRWLRIGWQLAVNAFVDSNEEKRSPDESLLNTFVERCIEESASTCLEQALWETLTQTTLEARSEYDRESVESFLELAKNLISDRALPVRLPQIDNTPILNVWIREVLERLNDSWSRISCDSCGRSATERGVIRLDLTRMTTEGTVKGNVRCTGCRKVRNKATLLSHCHGCGHYPLIIGNNPVGPDCKGLVCDWRDEMTGKRCKSCKKGCVCGQVTPEECFL